MYPPVVKRANPDSSIVKAVLEDIPTIS